ncbi:cbb3-type cytochrome oxidase subunit 3 [Yunchengibacter salinarum]|uniref:cbb3-type cytochrome oxidase subunit 3 n=1 Tax=Yunchengibacter salinarum TaxID=3133399 RepID=UPI0035B647AA
MYADLIYFAETWGLVFLVALFLVAVVYALWPRNRDMFDRAAHLPLEDDDAPTGDRDGQGGGTRDPDGEKR